MVQWLTDLLVQIPDDGNWAGRRRQIILARWPDTAVRAAEQDARQGRLGDLARYDAEVEMIKSAIPKPTV
ncbi:hypothetical protein K678_00175 [Magnetospirillum fulvum MGU-K5]|uniref:Uncharacterized protein n=1 Tax=Magnetospirillum fulvum MGU-K5 TaxID=1316936 RepID=S9TYS0_MAGFU|nr:hypothetical protein K678_00175 [Magnetospirillum fulvum MGU-K5]